MAYLLTPYDLDYILATTFGRLILQLAPSILLLLAITLGQPVAVQSSPSSLSRGDEFSPPPVREGRVGARIL